MAVPNNLASSHKYTVYSAVASATALIAAVINECVTLGSPVWTNPGAGGTIVSPVDAYGRYYQVAMTATSATQLTLVVTDQYGTTIDTRCIDLNATTGNDCVIYSGQYHLWIDSMRSTVENFRSGILDLTPRSQTAWITQVYCFAMRTSANAVTSNDSGLMSVSGLTASANIVVGPLAQTTGKSPTVTPAGDNVFWPVFLLDSGVHLGGRMYQVILVPATMTIGTILQSPIDVGVLAYFRVCGAVLTNTSLSMNFFRFAVRAD